MPRRGFVAKGARSFAAAVCLGFVACGGGPVVGTTRVETPLSDVVRAHKALLITSTAKRPEWTGDAAAIGTRVAPRLEKLGYFSVVIDGAKSEAAQGDLEIAIRLVELVKVNARERQGRGDDAGQVKAVVDVRLIDRASHGELGHAYVTAAGYEGPTGGTTDDAIDAIAQQILELVAGRAAAE